MARVGSDGGRAEGVRGGRRLRHEKDVFVRVNRAVTCIQRRRGHPPARRRRRSDRVKRGRLVETAEYLISDRMMAAAEKEKEKGKSECGG